ncbi:FAD binding domain-containing protein [Elioraea rosea]|uniref:FAD binding domain-containing protein n=1 Tax=Elioraea rosea TaxID=2492390 RepID=UPI0011839189|nr:FAD binding domain-containing protein [Elioraea rosea]
MTPAVETYATLAEAARAMASGDGVYLAGGTLLMRAVNAGEVPRRIIRTTDRTLREIAPVGDAVRIGAGVTMVELLQNRELAFLHAAARQVGGPQIRAMGTVGGNLFAPHPYGDLAVALLALGARVVMAGQAGARPLADLLRDRARTGLVAAIECPRPRDARSFGFLKVSRVHPRGASVVSIGAHLPREGGRIRGARIAFGAMGAAPLQASAAERALEGQALDAAAIARAGAVAAQGIDPPSDSLASSWYRREVSGVHLRRLLESMERG